eukprot:SAG11_NODE_4451_length_1889_cov_9.508939_2_plen_196_part_00
MSRHIPVLFFKLRHKALRPLEQQKRIFSSDNLRWLLDSNHRGMEPTIHNIGSYSSYNGMPIDYKDSSHLYYSQYCVPPELQLAVAGHWSGCYLHDTSVDVTDDTSVDVTDDTSVDVTDDAGGLLERLVDWIRGVAAPTSTPSCTQMNMQLNQETHGHANQDKEMQPGFNPRPPCDALNPGVSSQRRCMIRTASGG